MMHKMRRVNIATSLIIMLAVLLSLPVCSDRLPDKSQNGAAEYSDQVALPPADSETVQVEPTQQPHEEALVKIAENGSTIAERFYPPDGYTRTNVSQNSFGYYLRNLPLKSHGTKVKYYDGRIKSRDVYAAVVEMDIGDMDLQQCADAVIRLRAEYLYKNARYDDIHFNFTNGFNAAYSTWMQGYRITVNGNDVRWIKKTGYSNDYQSFRKYLDMVFSYAGTLSLSKELKSVSAENMQIGDVFIKGGSPGHCVIVVDMAQNEVSGKKVFMLAQSYMPAQDIHILKNTDDEALSPWFELDFGETLVTPEWVFTKADIERFEGGR